MSEQRTRKGRQINMRADDALVRELEELAELLSTPFVKASLADALRAVIVVGAPILRKKLAGKRAKSADAPAHSTPAARKPSRSNKRKRERT